ncbi:MAG: HAD family hydrolase [Candidatus Latescibacteria bacterium]|jgi:TFIIF-interacting CTD phosphatase-like protein|nr:HAD family hydrolase [Candidatus Latescibacterota bacterium]MBT4138990.1 HAD family hydrolase [Candidatus Latescibacterota bacterium]MBT5832645.1 HAD family hydrolase [Candidatus Latescibacterota bacterium]
MSCLKRRPHLDAFLAQICKDFNIAIWTSAGEEYAKCILDQIIPEAYPLEFTWTSDRCTQHINHEAGQPYLIKDLQKVKRRGYTLSRVLAIDDTPQFYEKSYGNLIPMIPFKGNPNDIQLLKVLPYLKWLKQHPNFRKIDKRHWQNHPSTRQNP